MPRPQHRLILICCLAILALAAATAVTATPTGHASIMFKGHVKSSGEITLTLTPGEPGAEPIAVTLQVEDGKSTQKTAKAMKMKLQQTLPGAYKVKRPDDKRVVVERRSGTEKFQLELTANTVEGLSISIN